MPDSPAPERSTGDLTDTGERCLPWIADTQVVYEHLHRYYFASLLVGGHDVIDVGCGEGYGAAILAELARTVIGIDIVPEVVAHARRTYERDNLHFEVASAVDLAGIEDDSADVVVCFEVIEHVREHEQDELIAAARRVLRPDGLLVISTPDRVPYNRSREPNPFHVHELSADELHWLLAGRFRHSSFWTQHLVIGSALTATPGRAGAIEATAVVRRDREWHRVTRSDDYLVAVASSRPLPALPAFSLLDDRARSLVDDAVRTAVDDAEAQWQDAVGDIEAKWQDAVQDAVGGVEAKWQDAVEELEERWQEAVDELVRRLADTKSESDLLRLRAESAEAEAARVTGSRSWRALQRLRMGRR
jgi:O-antigen biosynthesis protein